jgi:hypothetical protein
MNKNEISRRALEDAELNALTLQTIYRIKRGDTLPNDSLYRRLMERLQRRCAELETQDPVTPKDTTDWLALAIYGQDRDQFMQLYRAAEAAPDEVFERAQPWLTRFVQPVD